MSDQNAKVFSPLRAGNFCRPVMSLGVLFFGLVIVTSLLGPYPRVVSVGPTTMAGAISMLVPLVGIFIIFSHGFLKRSALRIVWPLAILTLLMWIQTFFQLTSPTPRVENTPVIFSGTLIVMLAVSISSRLISDDKFLKAFQRGITAFVILLTLISLTRAQDPATSQIAAILFPFLIVRIIYRPNAAFVLLAVLIASEIYLLESRIVLISLAVQTLAALCLLRGERPIHVSLGILLLIVFGASAILALDIKSFFGGGDRALSFNGFEINTAGRLHYWGIILESWRQHPVWGDGHSVAVEMFDVARWTQPHNEYLRILHMTGGVGLSLWIIFWLKLVVRLWQKMKSLDSPQKMSSTTIITYAALLSTIGISILMITDNTLVYSYVVYLWAFLVGRVATS